MRAGLWCRFGSITLLACSTVLAQPTSAARAHFARGLEQVELGDLDSAAANFEEAYRLSPNYAVLYNLGQAYASLGNSVEALHAFERYLELGGKKIGPERQTLVRQLVLLSKKRVGYVAFDISPPGAQLSIDGRAIDAASFRVPTALNVGVHGIVLKLVGFQTFAGNVKVESQRIVPLRIELERAPTSSAQTSSVPVSFGQVAVDSMLPELNVTLDGAAVERVGNDPFLAPVGPHRIRCQRDGYQSVERQLDVLGKGVVHVACDLAVLPKLQPSAAGLISFHVDQPGAEVLIDGRRASSSARLPRGLHTLRVRRAGFIDWTRTVTVRPGFPDAIVVQLTPTPERALDLARTTSKRRTLAYVIGGAGIALLGTSAALYVANDARYHRWAQQRDQVSSGIQAQGYNAELSTRAADIQATAVSIQRQDDAALGAAVVGGVLLGYAVISWLGSR